MTILAIIAIHIFVAFIVSIILNTFDILSCHNEGDTMASRAAFSFIWEITIPLTIIFSLAALLFVFVPELISHKIKSLIKIHKEKRAALLKELELKALMSRDTNGESNSFRSKPNVRKYGKANFIY